ncbi:MAG TPA: arylsulfotransferase family protein [Solirubrobacteraceae bacterium]|nr:arylsulfotransferase family protein [Solirubrobacteraceae bacterium]
MRTAACASILIGAAGAALGSGALAPAAARSSGGTSNPSRALDVLPFPGTPDAPSGTDIDFPAVSPGQIASVKVVGSRSGVHAGRLSAQPAGQGAAFSPRQPFVAGEQVSVTANLRSVTAGAASGAAGSRRLAFSFTVARPAHIAQTIESSAAAAGQSGGGATAGSSKTHSFVTHPTWHVPWITTSGNDTDTTSGRIFLNTQNSQQNAVYMVNGRGQILWYHPTASKGAGPAARMTRVENYKGHRVITFWQGKYVCPPCGGRGEGVIMNSSYKVIHTVKAGNGYANQGTDLHEFTLGHEGKEATAFVQIWSPVQRNLTSVGGPANGTVFDWIIQEIDIATGKVIWQWHALGHVPLTDSYERYAPGQPYDYFHLNSIQQLPSGRILISARHTWAVYSIVKKTGRIAWELGGKHSSFRMGSGTNFEWQHDASLHGHGLLTLFDDAATPKEEQQSRALEIHLANHQATLIHAYTHNRPVLSTAAGSVQILPNHNVFVDWGQAPYFGEYKGGGSHAQIFSDGFARPIESYRAYREPWSGHPPWAPGIAVRKGASANQFNVYASWNGSTQVGRWRVLVGPSKTGPFKAKRTVSWASFETRIAISSKAAYVRVQALGKKGKALAGGSSRAIKLG